jgi:hypothetical protein
VAQVVEHLHSKTEALTSSNTTGKNNLYTIYVKEQLQIKNKRTNNPIKIVKGIPRW